MSLHVELVSPERVVYEGDASLVVARTAEGEIGFQPGHVPFVGTLVPSVIKVVLAEGGEQRIAVHSGFVEVANDHLTLLSDVAELSQDIDVERARAAEQRAQATLAGDNDNGEALAALSRAQARLRAVQD